MDGVRRRRKSAAARNGTDCVYRSSCLAPYDECLLPIHLARRLFQLSLNNESKCLLYICIRSVFLRNKTFDLATAPLAGGLSTLSKVRTIIGSNG